MRRLLTILLLLTIAGAAAWTLYQWNRPGTTSADPWRALPGHTAIILELPDAITAWDHFMHTSQHWSTLEQWPGVAAAGAFVARIKARSEDDAALRSSLVGADVLITLMRDGAHGTGMLVVCRPQRADAEASGAFGQILGLGAEAMAAMHRGEPVQVRPDTAWAPLTCTLTQGLWLLASSTAVMEEALLELRQGQGLTQDTLLQRARKTLGGGDEAHVLLHLDRTRNLAGNWFTPDAVKDLTDLPAGWVALDLKARPDALLMSGLLIPSGAHPTLAMLTEQGSSDLGLVRALPASVDRMDIRHISAPLRYLDGRGIGAAEPLREPLGAWINGPVIIARSSLGDSTDTSIWALFTTGDPEGAVEHLTTLCANGCDTLSYRGQRLTRLTAAQDHERLFGPAFAPLGRPWWTVLGQQVVFSPTPRLLVQAVDAWYDGNSLAEDPRTNNWFARMGAAAGRLWWTDVARTQDQLRGELDPELRAKAGLNEALWSNTGGITIQISPGQRGYHHVVIGIQHAPLERPVDNTLWSTVIDAPIERKPDVVLNHTNNTREVLVQDTRHRIHLLSAAGKVLWQRALDGPIMGSVHQVDRFRNGKLQVLFNTAGKVYLIDRTGKDVGGFPVALKDTATAPLAVFDYDAQRDYRVLLPVSSGAILNLGMDGAATKGWEASRLQRPSVSAVRHIRLRNKDHLIVIAGDGSIRSLDRRGVERERVKLELGPNAKVHGVWAGQDLANTTVRWSDATGALMEATFGGTRTTLLPAAPGSWHLSDDRNSAADVVRIHEDTVVLYRNGKETVRKMYGARVAGAAHPYVLPGSGPTWGVVVPEREELILMDTAGVELPGMPLKAGAPCSIADLDLDGQLELITVTREGRIHVIRAPQHKENTP